jgi:serine/threonine protein kinase
MAKAPAARFETAGEIAIALEQALASGTIGRYQIKRILTTGGMGTVYLAYDPQIERDVAVKVIKNRRLDGDATALEDFRREAKIVASLEHDAIVPVYDFGEHQGKPYLVMRHMLGGSLDDRLQDHTTLSLEEICLALKRLAGALDYAHARGVLHCDIKPANVLLGKSGSAYLSDFGLARDIGRSDSSGARGSPPYMDPEQWQGQDHATAQTDIYQLGITLFEMLTGQRPYGGTRSAAFMYKHLLGPIPSARELNPALPPDCDLILAKALAKEPTDRFTTAGQMAKAFAAAALPAEQMETALDVEALSDTPPKARGLTQTGFWGWPPGWVWLLILLLPLVGYLIFRLAMASNGNGGGLASQVTDVPAAITLTVTEAAEEAMQTPETSNALFPAIADSVTITPTKALSATATWTPTPTNTLTPAPTDSTTATGTPPPTPPPPEVRVIPSSLSLRDGPGMIYGVVGYLYAGDIVTVVARTSGQGWYLVKTESGDLGWISAVYSTAVNQPAMTSVPTALTVPAPPPTATPTATRTPTPTPTVSRGDDGGGGGGPKPRPSPTID